MAFEIDPRLALNKLAFGPTDAELQGLALDLARQGHLTLA